MSADKWYLLYLLLAALGLLILSSSVTMLVPFCIGKLIDIIYSSDEDFTEMLWNLKVTCAVLSVIFMAGAFANLGRVYIVQTSGMYCIILQFYCYCVYCAVLPISPKQVFTLEGQNRSCSHVEVFSTKHWGHRSREDLKLQCLWGQALSSWLFWLQSQTITTLQHNTFKAAVKVPDDLVFHQSCRIYVGHVLPEPFAIHTDDHRWITGSLVTPGSHMFVNVQFSKNCSIWNIRMCYLSDRSKPFIKWFLNGRWASISAITASLSRAMPLWSVPFFWKSDFATKVIINGWSIR